MWFKTRSLVFDSRPKQIFLPKSFTSMAKTWPISLYQRNACIILELTPAELVGFLICIVYLGIVSSILSDDNYFCRLTRKTAFHFLLYTERKQSLQICYLAELVGHSVLNLEVAGSTLGRDKLLFNSAI